MSSLLYHLLFRNDYAQCKHISQYLVSFPRFLPPLSYIFISITITIAISAYFIDSINTLTKNQSALNHITIPQNTDAPILNFREIDASNMLLSPLSKLNSAHRYSTHTVVNRSIKERVFPSAWKTAIIHQ